MRRFAVVLALAVAGCSTTPDIPADKLTCAGEPAIPPAPVTDTANGLYLGKLRSAWADCSGKLKWVRTYSGKLR